MGNKHMHGNTRLYILLQIERVPLRSLHYCIKNSFYYTSSCFF